MVDRGSPHTATRQIADLIAADIDTGRLQPGDAVPSEVQLSQRYGVSRGTARAAVAMLRASGRVRTHFGRGTFVAEPLDRRTVEAPSGAVITAERSESGPVLRVTVGDQAQDYPGDDVAVRVP